MLAAMRHIFATLRIAGDFLSRQYTARSAAVAVKNVIDISRRDASISGKNALQYPQKDMNEILDDVRLKTISQKMNDDSLVIQSESEETKQWCGVALYSLLSFASIVW